MHIKDAHAPLLKHQQEQLLWSPSAEHAPAEEWKSKKAPAPLWVIRVQARRNWISPSVVASPKAKASGQEKEGRAAVLSVALSVLFCRSATDLARAALGSWGWPFHIHAQSPEVAAAACLAQACPILPTLPSVHSQWLLLSVLIMPFQRKIQTTSLLLSQREGNTLPPPPPSIFQTESMISFVMVHPATICLFF